MFRIHVHLSGHFLRHYYFTPYTLKTVNRWTLDKPTTKHAYQLWISLTVNFASL